MIEKLYTQKELVLLDISTTEFHEKFYIPEIQKLTFNLSHMYILGTHHCGKQLYEAFMHRGE